jgi:hypothetical protein
MQSQQEPEHILDQHLSPSPSPAELIEEGKYAFLTGKEQIDCPYTEGLSRFLWEQGRLAARCVAIKPSLANLLLLARPPEEIAEEYPEAVIAQAFATFRDFIDTHNFDLATAQRIVIKWLCDSSVDRDSFLKAMESAAELHSWPAPPGARVKRAKGRKTRCQARINPTNF